MSRLAALTPEQERALAEYSLLTLNTFALPLPGGWQRLKKQAEELQRLDVQMLCLQEIQFTDYVLRLIDKLQDYPHSAFIPRYVAPVGGLMTFSRQPLLERQFIPYERRGRLFSPGFMDWLLHKGVLETRLALGSQPIVVLNTHLQANYDADWSRGNRFACIQYQQMQQLAQFVRRQPAGALVIVCGDLNFPRGTFLYTELLERGGLVDPLAGHPQPSYKPFPLVAEKWSTTIDFVLLRLPAGQDIQLTADVVDIENRQASWAPLRFLTDHRALTLRLRW